MSNTYTPGVPSGGVDPITQALLQLLLGIGGNQSWQGAANPNLLGALSFGFDPTQMQGASLPQIPGTSDEDDMGFVEEGSKQANYFQDIMDLAGLGDIGGAAMAGPGSFSAESFAPTITNELIQQPATLQFQRYLDPVNAGTFEGRVAAIVAGGGTVSDAIAQMRRVIEFADTHPDDVQAKADADALRPYLPTTPIFDQMNPTEPMQIVDWQQATRQAQDLVDPYVAEQSIQLGPTGATFDPASGKSTPGGTIVEIDGQLYRQTSEESPLAEKFREAGIPNPTEQYGPADVLGPDWAAAETDYISALPGIQEQLAQYRADSDWASGRADVLAGLPLQEFYDRGSVPGEFGRGPGTIQWPDYGASLGNDILGGIGGNIVDDTAQSIAFTGMGDVLGAAEATGGAVNWGASMVRDAIARLAGVTPERLGQNTDPGAAAPRTVEEGAEAQAGNYAPLAVGSGGGGAAGMLLQGDIPAPGPGEPGSYLEYVLTGGDGRSSYEDWLAERQANGSYGTIGGQPADPGVQGPPMPAPTPLPAAPDTGWTPPPDWDWHNGAWFDGRGNLQGYSLGPGDPPDNVTGLPPQPAPPPPITPTYTGPLTAVPGSMRDILGRSSDANTMMGMAVQQANVGPAQPPQPTVDQMISILYGRQRPTEDDYLNQSEQTGRGINSRSQDDYLNQSEQTGRGINAHSQDEYLNQSEQTGRGIYSRTLLEGLWPRGQQPLWEQLFPPSQNASGRTGPEPSEQATRQSLWSQLFPDTSQNTSGRTGPEPSENVAMLRYGLDTQTSPGRVSNRRDLAVERERTRGRVADDKAREMRFAQNMAYRNIRGRDYWVGRGYTEQLQRMGITPTMVALANRTQGLNAMFGR